MKLVYIIQDFDKMLKVPLFVPSQTTKMESC